MKDKFADGSAAFGIHALFVCMNEEYTGNMVNQVLNSLGRASPESKRAFHTELDKLNLNVPGFRNASVALRSNPQRLKDPVRHGLLASDKLAGATLKVWAESHQRLRDIVIERIADIGTYISVSAEYPDFSENCLRGHWPEEAWDREKGRFAELHDYFEQDDIALMMCYVSGRLPGIAGSDGEQDPASEAVEQIPVILKLLALCAVDLADLPISAPEWESDIPELAGKIAETVGAKQEERSRATTLDSFIADIRNDFSTELAYLESDIASWSADKLFESGDIAKTLGTCEELRSTLAEFHAFRESIRENPLPSTGREERERRVKNDELENRASGLLDGIGRLMSGEPMPDDDPPGVPTRAEEQPEGGDAARTDHPNAPRDESSPTPGSLDVFPVFESERLYRENLSLQSERDKLRGDNERLRADVRKLESENETLTSENRTLDNDVQFLRADNADIKNNSEALQSKLTAKADEVEMWRRAYEEESQKPRLTVEDVPRQLNTVGDAVKYAREMFPERLVLRTNSKSVVQDNPFERPEDVWRALEWLATTYHSAKMGESSVPDFDLSIREMCGWWYKSDQHKTTRNKYRNWYTTRVNGDRRWLVEHIGTGSSKDARHTIRIAFDWDREEKIVVVGYIGQHQRTDAT